MSSVPSMTTNDIDNALSDLCGDLGWDYGMRLEVSGRCCWSCEIRLTRAPNTPGPDRSVVFFSAGGASCDQVAGEAYAALFAWLVDAEAGE